MEPRMEFPFSLYREINSIQPFPCVYTRKVSIKRSPFTDWRISENVLERIDRSSISLSITIPDKMEFL